MRGTLVILSACGLLLALTGCSLVLPQISHQPVIRNPFPQLSRVAVAPFFNQSDEATVDGRAVAMAYFAELQRTPGFEVVPVGVVEEAMIMHRVDLGGPGEARRLAQILGVDVVVVGAITDYSPYYPPRMGLRVEWYTSNPGFHEIPPGYGLPWHTPEEEFIPDSLAYEAKMSLARVQLSGQAPACDERMHSLPVPPPMAPQSETQEQSDEVQEAEQPGDGGEVSMKGSTSEEVWNELRLASASEDHASGKELLSVDQPATEGIAVTPELISPDGSNGKIDTLPPTGPDENGFLSPLPYGERPACIAHNGPVLMHTRIYRGTDPEVTEALKGYVYFRDDARFGGWRSYLQRSDDFTRFCCHMHISEMLSARGGSRKTRVLWRWPDSR